MTIKVQSIIDWLYNITSTNRSWSIDFHTTVVQMLMIVLKQNYKMELVQVKWTCGYIFSIEPRSNKGGEYDDMSWFG